MIVGVVYNVICHSLCYISPAYDTCGVAGNVEVSKVIGKVVAGNKAKVGAWPWQTLFFENYGHKLEQVQFTTHWFLLELFLSELLNSYGLLLTTSISLIPL